MAHQQFPGYKRSAALHQNGAKTDERFMSVRVPSAPAEPQRLNALFFSRRIAFENVGYCTTTKTFNLYQRSVQSLRKIPIPEKRTSACGVRACRIYFLIHLVHVGPMYVGLTLVYVQTDRLHATMVGQKRERGTMNDLNDDDGGARREATVRCMVCVRLVGMGLASSCRRYVSSR
jgi:hypothetical protein